MGLQPLDALFHAPKVAAERAPRRQLRILAFDLVDPGLQAGPLVLDGGEDLLGARRQLFGEAGLDVVQLRLDQVHRRTRHAELDVERPSLRLQLGDLGDDARGLLVEADRALALHVVLDVVLRGLDLGLQLLGLRLQKAPGGLQALAALLAGASDVLLGIKVRDKRRVVGIAPSGGNADGVDLLSVGAGPNGPPHAVGNLLCAQPRATGIREKRDGLAGVRVPSHLDEPLRYPVGNRHRLLQHEELVLKRPVLALDRRVAAATELAHDPARRSSIAVHEEKRRGLVRRRNAVRVDRGAEDDDRNDAQEDPFAAPQNLDQPVQLRAALRGRLVVERQRMTRNGRPV